MSNTITGPDNGIHGQLSSNSNFISNDIEVQGNYGIDAYDCDFSRIDSNIVRGYGDGFEYGIRAHDSYYVNIETTISKTLDSMEFTLSSANAIVNYNRLIESSSADWVTGIHNSASNQFAQMV